MESMIWYEHSERTEYDQRRVATRLFYNVCPEPYATRVDALFSVDIDVDARVHRYLSVS